MTPADQTAPAVILDLDGTLVDSVYQHVDAWHVAFHAVGRRVPSFRIHEAIGMGGDRLVAHVAGETAEAAVGDEVRDLHGRHFRAGMRTVEPLDGADELVQVLAGRGHRVVLASSAEREMVDDLLDLVGVRHHLHAVVTGSADAASKPAPDLVQIALEEAGGGPCVVIGDATWDAMAARSAGVGSIALGSGGIAESVLRTAGATHVFADPRDLLTRLHDDDLIAAAAAAVRSTR